MSSSHMDAQDCLFLAPECSNSLHNDLDKLMISQEKVRK